MGSASVLVASITPEWPFVAIITLGCFFGATALGWNGVYLAEVARIWHEPMMRLLAARRIHSHRRQDADS
jgi:hypothetical protein